ncbi:Crp/Fnr family transcriptional regulator [Anaerostipes sp.]|uniref:Crp/Fnr family transcriptional regulator n=1 Tax=Anaerostipes sp. TaxID=1872530 RepID=UPI0025C59FC3|nr:Crp/Fnr family transcriptional regulator [Anaerostipes sp.]MBS7007378.1 Crp/Fnr family transcriptional regulator [Anaerostipes sp.]
MDKPSKYLEQKLILRFSNDLCNRIDETAQIVHLKKGSTVLYQGEQPVFIYFVCEGLMRGYYIDEEGNDITKCFAEEGEFACSEGLRTPGEATFSVETMEACQCIRIPYAFLSEDLKTDSVILEVIHRFTQKALKAAEAREEALLTKSASKRYLDFQFNKPNLARRLSQKHLASYLGIRPGSLCRIKNQLADLHLCE